MADEPNPPGMLGSSPSERGLPAMPADPALHAIEFSRRRVDKIEPEAGRIMRKLGLPPERIGGRDIAGGNRGNFFPGEHDGGGLAPGGKVTLDSGIFDPELMAYLGAEASGKTWDHARDASNVIDQVRFRAMVLRNGPPFSFDQPEEGGRRSGRRSKSGPSIAGRSRQRSPGR